MVGPRLLSLAKEVREAHPGGSSHCDPDRRPADDELQALGLKPADSARLADAVALDASHFLTLDKGIIKRPAVIENKWGFRVRRPSEFLLESVRAGAPSPTTVPWPCESGPLSAGRPYLGHMPSRNSGNQPAPVRTEISALTWANNHLGTSPTGHRPIHSLFDTEEVRGSNPRAPTETFPQVEGRFSQRASELQTAPQALGGHI